MSSVEDKTLSSSLKNIADLITDENHYADSAELRVLQDPALQPQNLKPVIDSHNNDISQVDYLSLDLDFKEEAVRTFGSITEMSCVMTNCLPE